MSDEYQGEGRRPLDPEAVARWVALTGAAVALGGLAVTLGATLAPWVAWTVALVVTGATAASLWRRHLDQQSIRREQERVRPRGEPLSLPEGWSPPSP